MRNHRLDMHGIQGRMVLNQTKTWC